MCFCDLDRERAASLAEEVGGSVAESLAELAETDLIVIAVKPGALEAVAAELAPAKPAALLSILAATPLARLATEFPDTPALRLMPNQPVEVRQGVLCYALPEEGSSALPDRTIELLEVLGYAVELEEHLIDAAMAVMSCSPAYIALFAELLADAGAREGLEEDLSARLVRETLTGTAALLGAHKPTEVRRRVAPPGGATEAGLQALEQGGMRSAVEGAVHASLERFR